jgi:HK97 family phage major capsid protein
MPGIDHNRKTTNVIFDPDISNEIITKAIDESAFMQLAQSMQIAGNGKKYQTITGDPEPEWVGETEAKPVGKFTFGTKTVEPYKMAIIVPFSDEFKRDKNALYNECVGRLPKLFGPKIDKTIMGTTPPGQNFDVLGNTQTVSLTPASGKTLYDQFIAVDALIGANNYIMNGIALAPQGRSVVLSAVDADKHPLFTAGVQSGTINPILGANVSVKRGVYVAAGDSTPAVLGLAGDFTKCSYGIVQRITGAVSEEATITYIENGETQMLPLWQHNMFAIRFEMEIAFMVRDETAFVRLTA